MSAAGPVGAQEFLEDMALVDISVGDLSALAADFRSGSGLLSDGTQYSFERYYNTDFPDLRVTMLSPVSSNFGILWGFGTGERGSKYKIEPSIKVGFLAVQDVGDSAQLSLSVSTILGGYFRESSCTADYGAIGGVQEVNCRLAGSPLPPSETLRYLEMRRPADQIRVSLQYRLRF